MFAFYCESASNGPWQTTWTSHAEQYGVAKHYLYTFSAVIISESLLTLLVSIIFPSSSNGGDNRATRALCYTPLSPLRDPPPTKSRDICMYDEQRRIFYRTVSL